MFSPDFLPFESALGYHLFVVDGSRIYDIDEAEFQRISRRPDTAFGLLADAPGTGAYISDAIPELPKVNALSLNVAQSCNLACGYCYAGEGRFGGKAKLMSEAVAMQSIELLLDEASEAGSAVLGFMGGEPFLNRSLLRSVTEQAASAAAARGIDLRFTVTTNATLLTEDDAAFLSNYRFTVAVSLDGSKPVNDAQRPDHAGRGSFDQARAGLDRLLANDGCHVSARATVTPHTGELLPLLEALLETGVHEAGFAPVLVSPNPGLEFKAADFDHFLQRMIACGEVARDAILNRRRFPFSNFETGIGEIARGSHRPYSCSAAAGYGSVDADGDVFGCHRAIGDEKFRIGDLTDGLDDSARNQFLTERHVLKQEPCNTCWARFLCGGGCHQEILARGRIGCDYIRGWLRFLLESYVEIGERTPDYLTEPNAHFAKADMEINQ